jgi:hypothetical protein
VWHVGVPEDEVEMEVTEFFGLGEQGNIGLAAFGYFP